MPSDRVISSANPRWVPLAPADRWAALAAFAGFSFVVLVALWLTPDPRGIGTHEQLGLPPCTAQAWFHIPCPFCGMTTAFSLMVHGRFADAFRVQPAGALMFGCGVPVSVVCLVVAAMGSMPIFVFALLRRPFWLPGLVILLLAWFYKIAISL